jgi:L-arabinose isomerase
MSPARLTNEAERANELEATFAVADRALDFLCAELGAFKEIARTPSGRELLDSLAIARIALARLQAEGAGASGSGADADAAALHRAIRIDGEEP